MELAFDRKAFKCAQKLASMVMLVILEDSIIITVASLRASKVVVSNARSCPFS